MVPVARGWRFRQSAPVLQGPALQSALDGRGQEPTCRWRGTCAQSYGVYLSKGLIVLDL